MIKKKFKQADLVGQKSPERLLKERALWDLASAMGISNEDAKLFLAYAVTSIHNAGVRMKDEEPEFCQAALQWAKATCKLYPLGFDDVHPCVIIGMENKVDDVPKPHFLDVALGRLRSGKAQVSVGFFDVLAAQKNGLN